MASLTYEVEDAFQANEAYFAVFHAPLEEIVGERFVHLSPGKEIDVNGQKRIVLGVELFSQNFGNFTTRGVGVKLDGPVDRNGMLVIKV